MQRMVKGVLLECGALVEPCAVEPVLLATGPALVVDELGHGAQQAALLKIARWHWARCGASCAASVTWQRCCEYG